MNITRLASQCTLIIVSFFSIESIAQINDSDLITTLDQKIIPITTFQPDSNFQDLEFLKQTLKERKIIALGEATHGTHEFFKYKDRLTRFLVTELDFKAIAFESDFVAVSHLDDYVNGKTDTVHFVGGFPLNEYTKAMLEWLKNYNELKPQTERVHLFGLESRGFKNIIKSVIDSFPDLSVLNKNRLLKVQNSEQNLLTSKHIAELKLILPALYALSSQPVTPDVHKHYVRLLEQQIDYYLTTSIKQIGLRDEYMFENASWIKERADNNKIIIWAHNGHLSKSNIYWQAPLGKHLYQKHGAEYYVIATDFNHGEVKVFVKNNNGYKRQDVYYPEISSAKGYEFYFSKLRFDNFFIDVREASKDGILNSFFKKSREMRSIGGTEKPSESKLTIADCFDLVAFFNRTTASK